MKTLLIMILTLVTASACGAGVLVEEGTLGDAPYALALPDRWEGGLLVIAHGWRPASAPVVAVLEPEDPLVRVYLDRGWMVAATGYRRNGWILEDAAEDIAALITLVRDDYGTPGRVVVEGTSLGANIGLWLCEAEAPLLDGLVALAADPTAEGPDGPTAWDFHPRVPVLLMSNRDEYAVVEDYAGRVGGEAVKPGLWILDRDGHVNLNLLERFHAHAALQEWLEGGVRPRGWVGEPYDATMVPDPRPSVARSRDGGLEGTVIAIEPVFGNLTTDLVAADLETVAGREGGRFLIRGFGAEEKIMWGATYADVKADNLVAFVDADGRVQIAVNRGNAADRLSVREGDAILVKPSGRKKNDPRR